VSFEALLLFVVGATMPIEDFGTFRVAGYPVGPGKAATALLLLYAVANTLLTRRGIAWNVKHLWVVLFAGSLLLANFIGGLEGVTIASRFVLWTSYLAVLIFYFLVPWTLRSSRQIEFLLTGLAFGAYAAVLIGFLRPEAFEGTVGEERFIGTTGNPNDLGFGMALVIPLALAMVASRRRGCLKQLFFLGAIGTALVGVVLSLSRSAFLMVVAIGALYTWRFGSARAVRYLPPALAATIAVVLLAPETFFQRMATIREGQRSEDSSIQMRLIEYKWGLHAFVHNPLVGVGDGLSGRYAVQHGAPMGEGHVIHNVYIDAAAEQGIVGLIPLLAIVALSWVDFSHVRRWSRDPALRDDEEVARLGLWATFFQIALLGAVVGQQFGPFLRKKEFWLLIGLSSALVAMFRARVLERHPHLLQRRGSSAANMTDGMQPLGEGR
jgi:O-antigen ligase